MNHGLGRRVWSWWLSLNLIPIPLAGPSPALEPVTMLCRCCRPETAARAETVSRPRAPPKSKFVYMRTNAGKWSVLKPLLCASLSMYAQRVFSPWQQGIGPIPSLPSSAPGLYLSSSPFGRFSAEWLISTLDKRGQWSFKDGSPCPAPGDYELVPGWGWIDDWSYKSNTRKYDADGWQVRVAEESTGTLSVVSCLVVALYHSAASCLTLLQESSQGSYYWILWYGGMVCPTTTPDPLFPHCCIHMGSGVSVKRMLTCAAHKHTFAVRLQLLGHQLVKHRAGARLCAAAEMDTDQAHDSCPRARGKVLPVVALVRGTLPRVSKLARFSSPIFARHITHSHWLHHTNARIAHCCSPNNKLLFCHRPPIPFRSTWRCRTMSLRLLSNQWSSEGSRSTGTSTRSRTRACGRRPRALLGLSKSTPPTFSCW